MSTGRLAAHRDTSGNRAIEDSATIFQQQLERLDGVSIVLEPVDQAAIVERWFAGGWGLTFSTLSTVGPDTRLTNTFRTGGSFNFFSGYSNAAVDEALDRSRATTDPDEVQAAYDEVQELVTAGGSLRPVPTPATSSSLRPRVQDIEFHEDARCPAPIGSRSRTERASTFGSALRPGASRGIRAALRTPRRREPQWATPSLRRTGYDERDGIAITRRGSPVKPGPSADDLVSAGGIPWSGRRSTSPAPWPTSVTARRRSPSVVHLFEQYVDQAALDAHRRTAAFAAAQAGARGAHRRG